MQRPNCPYEKKKTSFRLEGGKEESARKVARISTTEPLQKTIKPEHSVEDTMTETELKKKKVNLAPLKLLIKGLDENTPEDSSFKVMTWNLSKT